MKQLSIAIAGGGPAGLAAALLLDADGHRVTIFDRFAQPAPLGSGLMLQPSGMAVLAQLGLATQIVKRGARIDRLEGLERNGDKVLDSPYHPLGHRGVFGLGIHRASLFSVLLKAAKARAIAFELNHAVTGLEQLSAGVRLTFANQPPSPRFDLIVDASGWQSVFDPADAATKLLPFGALWASLPLEAGDPFAGNLLEQRYHRAQQMVGVLPIGQRAETEPQEAAFFWSLPCADYATWQATPLEQWQAQVRDLWPETGGLLSRIERREQLTFARYAHRTMARPVRQRFIAIGDAWHSASPQLGQGANMALLDAWSLARGLAHGKSLGDGLRLAHGWRHDHVLIYQWLTALFTPLYQSKHGWHASLRDRVINPLSKIWPITKIQAQMMAGLFGFPLPSLGLKLPDYDTLAQALPNPADQR